MVLSFDTRIAEICGVNAAIMFHNICFWILKNASEKRNFFDGRYWTYNTRRGWASFCPFFTERQVRECLEKLRESGLIFIDYHNENKFDRTPWYALTDLGESYFDAMDKIRPMERTISVQSQRTNSVQCTRAINTPTNINTDIKHIAREDSDFWKTEDIPADFKKWTLADFQQILKNCPYPELHGEFESYWTEPDAKGKMRFQLEKTWETSRRLATWANRSLNRGGYHPSPNAPHVEPSAEMVTLASGKRIPKADAIFLEETNEWVRAGVV